MNYWIITKDLINTEGPNNVGFGYIKALHEGEVSRHRCVDLEAPAVKAWMETLPCKIRLYDDDGELYYEGLSSDADFDAQDYFGGSDGITYTMHKFKRESKWALL